jgi:hypothetical protein
MLLSQSGHFKMISKTPNSKDKSMNIVPSFAVSIGTELTQNFSF